MKKRQVLTLSGMTTAGKSTFADRLKETDCFEEVVSFTTRPQRPGEIDGQHYHFITKEEAVSIIDKGEAVDYTKVNGNYYGNDKSAYDDVFEKGKVPVVVCDPQGPININKNKDVIDADVYAVFIDADPETLATRMFDRMVAEQEHINHLFDVDEDSGITYKEKYINEYGKRLGNMSDLDNEDISVIINMVENYVDKKENNEKVNALQIMKLGMASDESKEAQWRTDFDYAKVVKAEDLENNLSASVNDFKESLCDSTKKKNKHYSMSM